MGFIYITEFAIIDTCYKCTKETNYKYGIISQEGNSTAKNIGLIFQVQGFPSS